MPCINAQTFIANETQTRDDAIEGTVEVTLGNKTKRVEARKWKGQYSEGDITAYGMTGRYQTGAKAWKACILLKANGDESGHFGRYDNHPKFRKMRGISFAE